MESQARLHEAREIEFQSPYSNVTVGPAPLNYMDVETASKYNVFINVAENSEYSLLKNREGITQKCLWFPIDETTSWNEISINNSVKALDFHYNEGSKVYLHCNKGVNRSPSIAMIWLMSRKHNLEESSLISSGGNLHLANEFQKNLRRNAMRGFISRKWIKN